MEKFMKQLFAVAVWGLLGVLGWTGQAQAVTKQCDGCTVAQMDDLAYWSLSEMRYSALYVIDMRGGVVRKYARRTNANDPGFDPEIDVTEIWAELLSTEAVVVNHIQQASVYYAPC